MTYTPPPFPLRVWLLDVLLDPLVAQGLTEDEWVWVECEVRDVVTGLLGLSPAPITLVRVDPWPDGWGNDQKNSSD